MAKIKHKALIIKSMRKKTMFISNKEPKPMPTMELLKPYTPSLMERGSKVKISAMILVMITANRPEIPIMGLMKEASSNSTPYHELRAKNICE
jgi:hypothetical protein